MTRLSPIAPLAVFAVAFGAAACTRDPAPPPVKAGAPTKDEHGHVAWLSDDWSAARARAIAGNKIVLVDAWAPWCHTCWSMKREVLHDPSLAAFADRVVFLEVDTDRPQNAAFVARFPVRVWPTFFAIAPATDAASDRIIAVQGGSMSLDETRAFLERAARSANASASGANAAGSVSTGAPSDPIDVALIDGYRALQAGDAKAAAARFAEAAAKEGPRRTEAVFAQVRALREAKRHADCAEAASSALDVVTGSASAGDLAGYALLCADAMEKDGIDPSSTDGEYVARYRANAQKKLEALADAPAPGAAVDDRAAHMGDLADLYDKLGKKAEARAMHEKRLALMEADADQAKTPVEARTHDYARMNSYIALERGDDAVKLFKRRVAEFPSDYEAHARLASTLVQLKRFDEALPIAERAVQLSYGPRKLRYLNTLAGIHKERGDAPAERATLDKLVQHDGTLDDKQKNAELRDKATARLAALDGSTAPAATAATAAPK